MQILATSLDEVFIIKPKVIVDDRGFFLESFNRRHFEERVGFAPNFVQDNVSGSSQGVLRGLHYQIEHPQGKLVQVCTGSIFHVVVDIRKSSRHFGQWFGVELSEKNHLQLWVPAGFAQGFLVLSEPTVVFYKTTDYWYPEHERCIRWDDVDVGIDWPLNESPKLSTKDRSGKNFFEAEVFK